MPLYGTTTVQCGTVAVPVLSTDFFLIKKVQRFFFFFDTIRYGTYVDILDSHMSTYVLYVAYTIMSSIIFPTDRQKIRKLLP